MCELLIGDDFILTRIYNNKLNSMIYHIHVT